VLKIPNFGNTCSVSIALIEVKNPQAKTVLFYRQNGATAEATLGRKKKTVFGEDLKRKARNSS
jgi:hypothetical protein